LKDLMMKAEQSERARKIRTLVCSIGIICALLTILCIASALAVRLLEMGDPGDAKSFPFNLFQFGPSDAELKHDSAVRTRLWVLAIVDATLALASTIMGIMAIRTHSKSVGIGVITLGVATTVIAFLLAWPLGILSSIIPLTAIIAMLMRHAPTE
tara:strand:+ start:1929 stop:2393 length:465 start_codon:yes stop_codon:yes gene_type:complete